MKYGLVVLGGAIGLQGSSADNANYIYIYQLELFLVSSR